MHDRGTGKGKHMKIAQRMRRPAGWDDEQIAGIHAVATDIVLIRRPVPVDCAEIVARGRVGEARFHTTARGAKNKIDRGLDHLELKAPVVRGPGWLMTSSDSSAACWPASTGRGSKCGSIWPTFRLARSSIATTCSCGW